jgi:DNA-binding CsgD family transcriptional regulator
MAKPYSGASSRRDPTVHSWISRERLEQLYVRDGLTTLEVAERLGTNRESIRKLIHHYELPMRSRGSG